MFKGIKVIFSKKASAPKPTLPFCVRWDQGTREQQEDAWALTKSPDGNRILFVVADGLGGQASGELASQALVKAMKQSFLTNASLAPADVLRKGRDEAVAALKNIAGNAATTFVAAIVERNEQKRMNLTCLWAGDCRAFLATSSQRDPGPDAIPVWPSSSREKAELWLLTKDHSLVWSLFESGERTLDEISSHPMRNQVQCSVDATGEHLRDAVANYSLAPEERLFFCTDGVWEGLPIAELGNTLLSSDSVAETHNKLERLLEAGLRNGNVSDNNTYIIAEVGRTLFQSSLPRKEQLPPPRKRLSIMHLARLVLLLSLPIFLLLLLLYLWLSNRTTNSQPSPTNISSANNNAGSTGPVNESSPTPPASADANKNRQGQSSGTRKNEGEAHKPGQNENTRRAATSETKKQSPPTETAAVPVRTQSGESSVPKPIPERQPQQRQPSQPVSGGQSDLNEQQQGLGQEGQTTPISSSPPQNQREAPVSVKEKKEQKDKKELNDSLIEAAKNKEGKAEKVKELLEKGADVNAKDNDGITALMWAAKSGRKDIVDILVQKSADINAKTGDGTTMLMCAAEGGIKEFVELLISKGADVNAKNNFGWTALMAAAKSGHKDVCELLISKGADINAKSNKGTTMLMCAAGGGIKEFVEFLISKGADVNAKTNNGWTALMEAAKSGHKDVCKFLISKGADVKAKGDDGTTMLMCAAEGGIKEFVELLISKGADVNAKNNFGWTALMAAAAAGYKDVCDLLISKRADINAKNNDGKTALKIALEKGKTDVADYLRSKGATE